MLLKSKIEISHHTQTQEIIETVFSAYLRK